MTIEDLYVRIGWEGPTVPGEVPTLGFVVADWIEENLTAPDGTPIILTTEQRDDLLAICELPVE